MTIDEEIVFERKLADYYKDNHLKNEAEEHEQRAEWLEELKTIKEMDLSIPQHFTKEQSDWIKAYCVKRNIEFYNKAIDDFAKWLENKKYLMKEIQERDFCYTHYDELKANCVTKEYFAEQLKAGGENENYNKEES